MQHIDLTLIDPNPWQPRKNMDPAGIEELAADIATRQANRPETHGLLQVPAAREVNGRYQLAYGHRRHAAFLLLEARVEDWPQNMPLEIVTFSDEEMASAAWSENMARKDLTAIEEAEFIARFMDNFNLTHKVAAERLAMSRPTLSNRLRLLKLPGDIRAAVNAGTMPERTALALLPLYDLSEKAWAAAEETKDEWRTKPSDVVQAALAGKDSDWVRERASRAVRNIGEQMMDWLPLDFKFALEGIEQPACKGCPNLVIADEERQCLNAPCLALKTEAWPDIALDAAVEASGIPLAGKTWAGDIRMGGVEDFWYDDPMEELDKLVQGMTCKHRRLDFDEYDNGGVPVDAAKFPGVTMVCTLNDHCQCALAAEDAYLAKTLTPEELAERVAERAEQAEEKKKAEAKRQAEQPRVQKDWAKEQRDRDEAVKKMRKELLEPVKAQLVKLLAKGDLPTLRLLTLASYQFSSESAVNILRKLKPLKDANAVWQNLAGELLDDALPWEAKNTGDVKKTRAALQKLNDLGVAIQLPAEDEKPRKAAKRGKQKKAAA